MERRGDGYQSSRSLFPCVAGAGAGAGPDQLLISFYSLPLFISFFIYSFAI